MKIIIKKHEEALDRESVKVACGNSWKKPCIYSKNLWANGNIKGQFYWNHNLIYFKCDYQDTCWLLGQCNSPPCFFSLYFYKTQHQELLFQTQLSESWHQKLPAVRRLTVICMSRKSLFFLTSYFTTFFFFTLLLSLGFCLHKENCVTLNGLYLNNKVLNPSFQDYMLLIKCGSNSPMHYYVLCWTGT